MPGLIANWLVFFKISVIVAAKGFRATQMKELRSHEDELTSENNSLEENVGG